jgi:hypothetical protein
MTVNVDRISAEAREVQFRRAFLTAIAAVLYGIGWLARRTFIVLWLALTWSWSAVRLGWQEAAPAKGKR